MKVSIETKKTSQQADLNLVLDSSVFEFTQLNKSSVPKITDSQTKATPFVKWVGGKRGIIKELINYLPGTFSNYYEPFAGGAALFYEINNDTKKHFLSDINLDLIITYKVIQKNPIELIESLRIHNSNHSEEYYYQVRSQHILSSPIETASRFLYLNKTCYNGLWRVNKKGEFNVPVGKYSNPNIVQEDNILACHTALKNAEIEYKNFDTIEPSKNDLCYFDPPYHPVNSDSFTTYTKLNFTETDQIRLRDFCDSIDKRGVYFMLSNSDSKFIRDIYKSYKVHTVSAPRFVNCKAGERNSVNEVLITNY